MEERLEPGPTSLLDLPPTLLSEVLWEVHEQVWLNDWLELRMACSAFSKEISRLILVRESLNEERWMGRKRRIYVPRYRSRSSAWMPSDMRARYFQQKFKLQTPKQRSPLGAITCQVAEILSQHELGNDSMSNQLQFPPRYDEIMYLLCEANTLHDPGYKVKYDGSYDEGLETEPTRNISEDELAVHLAAGAAYLGMEQVLLSHLSEFGMSNSIPGSRSGDLLNLVSSLDVFSYYGLPINAAARNSFKITHLLLQRGFKAQVRPRRWREPARCSSRSAAALRGNYEIVRLLSRQDNLPEVVAGHSETYELECAILAAVQGGHDEIVHYLLQESTNLQSKREFASQMTWFAAKYGHARLVEEGLARGGDISMYHPGFFVTPLGVACSWGHEDVVDLLLERGANPDGNYDSPMRCAITHGHVRICRRLRNAGVDVKKSCWMDTAGIWGKSKVVDFLLENGFDVHRANGWGRLPSLYTPASGGYVTIVEKLIAAGVDPTSGEDKTRSAGKTDALELIQKAKAKRLSAVSQRYKLPTEITC